MDDIEDYGAVDVPIDDDAKRVNKGLVFPKTHAKQADGVEVNGNVPGTQKIWVRTYGCSHNVSDSEYMEGILANYGFTITEDQESADLWLVNSCTVKDPSQAAFMNVVNKAKEKDRPVVVAGCVSQADRKIPGLDDVSTVGITQIDRVVEVVESTLEGNTMKLLGKKDLPSLDLPKVRKNPLVEIIPLSTGCLGACTYCKTKHARGTLGSYKLEAIVDRVKTVVKEGVMEVWLSSEDTGAYGRDIGTDIGKLLKAIIAVIPDGVMLRVGMTNPPYMLEHLEVIAEILRHPRVYAFLHVPVQSGSNRVLEGMNREYTVEEFRRVADYLTEHVPEITLATDIICGFPNETEEDFDETMALVEHYKLAITNISQFYPRPGTPAAKMKRIKTDIVKNRSRRLTKLFESFTPYTHLPGKRVQVWFNTEISDDGRQSVGHTKHYVKVLVPMDPALPGTSYMVDISACQRFHIEGTVVGDNLIPPRSSSAGMGIRYEVTVKQTADSKGKERVVLTAVADTKDGSGSNGCGGGGGDDDKKKGRVVSLIREKSNYIAPVIIFSAVAAVTFVLMRKR
jgi:threonylcarbamoyladenosine tRNA methylthiotransferase CDKAL1